METQKFGDNSQSLLESLNKLANQAAQIPRRLSATEAQRKTLEQVEIEVGVEVGELLISVADLLRLSPGDSFQVHFPTDSPVTLRVSGEAIGTAKLSAQGEELLLTVTDLASSF